MGRLGYSSITLTDLTETLSTSLVLESNHYSQTKIGNTYSPNFTESGNGVVITPSLFIGQSKIEIVQNGPLVKPATGMNDGYICYKIGEVEYSNATHPSGAIYVDSNANLHINKNLTDSVTIVAYITNYRDTTHSYTVEKIQAANPVNILFLENNSTGYQATITATRPYFQDTNASDISLTAKLYNGTQEITSGVSYNWSAVTNSSYSSTSKTITVARASISNREYYTCKITHNGITYTANQMLYDFTDMYSCEIGYDKALIFTDKAKTIELTARVYLNGEEIISGVDGYNLSYEWTALVEGSTSPIALTGTAQTYSLQNNDARLKGKNYLVFCEVSQTNSGTTRRIASSSVSVSYSPVYRAVITPNTIFVPTKSNGDYSGVTSGKYSFTFKLVGEDGNPLAKTGTAAPTGTSITFAQASAGKWDYTGEITLPTNSWSTIGDFKIYDFSYTYLGQSFTESVYVVKQKAGADGSNGTPGDSAYTVFLSNENFSFASSGEKAVANQTKETKVYAYQGTTQRPVKVMKVKGVNASTLTGGVKADIKDNDNVVILQFSVSNNNTTDTKITFYSTNNLHGADEFDIELEVDGITFYRRISYTVPASVVLSTHSIQYAVSNSGTDVPTTGWSDALPTVDKGEYLWTRTTIKYNDEPPSVSYTVAYNGTDGADGQAGRGIAFIEYFYAVTTTQNAPAAANVTASAIPTLSSTNKYLWQKEKINYSDNTNKVSVILLAVYGDKGADGVTIRNTTKKYATGESGTTPPSSGWGDTAPTVPEGDYLWTKTTITYSDNTTNELYSSSYNGVSYYTHIRYSANSNGASMTVEPAENSKYMGIYTGTSSSAPTTAGSYKWSKYAGEDGTTITEVVVEYITSENETKPASTAAWSPTFPTNIPEGYYLWTRTTTKYSAGSNLNDTESFSVSRIGTSVSINNTEVKYAVSTSGTTAPTGTSDWKDSIPTNFTNGTYLWTRTKVNYSDGESTTSYSVSYKGTNGVSSHTYIRYSANSDGASMTTTPAADTKYIGIAISTSSTPPTAASSYTWSKIKGEDGLGIRNTKEQYYLSTSNTDTVGGDWVDIAPPWQLGTYMWTRSVITYDDDSTYATEGLCVSSWDSVIGIEIGARNLHFGTENWDDVAFVTKSTATVSGEELKLPKNSAPNGMLVPITPGELYTVSVDIKTDDDSATEQNHVGIWFWTDETNYLSYAHCVYIRGNYSQEWKRYSVTFTAPDGVKYLQVSPRNASSNNYVYFKKLMVERGNKATDWSPAPEDIQQTTDVEYRLSNSSTSLTGSYTWNTTAPQWVNGKYMWSRTKITYRNGTVKYAPSANGTCISGATGATGNGISDMIHKYAISATMERPADSEFTLDSPPEVLPAGCKSVWHKQTIQFTNGTSQTFYTLETTRGEDASAYSLIDITPSAINYGITNGIGFFEESAITAKGVRYSADSTTAIPLTSEDGKVWLYGSIDNAKWVNIVNGRSLDAQGKFEYRLSEAWGWDNNNLILGHKALNGQGDCECVRPNLNSTFNQGLSTSIQIDENNTIAYNSTPLESSAKEHGYVRIHLDKIIKRYHLTAGDKLIYSIYTWSTMPDTNNNNVINFWIDKTDDNLIVDIKMEAENYQSDSSTSWKRVFYTFTLTEQMVSEARYLYFYYKNLQPAGNGTTHYRRWTAPKLEIATPEKTQPTAWGYNRKASWRPDIFGYRFFRMELWDASGERKYDEQTIPVIQENSLYSSQNLLRGTDVKIYPLLEEESVVGLTTGRFGLINNLEPIDLMGQVITISYLRYFSPNGVITQIDTNGDKRFGCSLNSEFTFQRGTSRATLKWGWLYNDQSFSGAFENGARRVSETEYIYKPIYYSPDNDETIYTEEDLVEIAVDGGYYLNYKTNTPNDLPYISRPKLEFGARQSAWLPSQEDISFSSIKGMNLLENSYRKQVDSSGFSFRIDTNDDYTLSWESISSNGQAKIFNNGVELSAYTTPLEKNGGTVIFRNLKQDYVLLILPQTTGTSITFSKLKLERGTERTPWILADGDVQEVIKEAEDYVNKDNIINILNAGGAIIPVLPEDYENIKRVMETVINNDPEQKALSSFLQVYQPATAKGEDKFYFREIISAIDLGYDQNGTPYLQLSTQFSAEEGNSSNYYMKLTNEKLGFYENEKELAYFSSSQMFINGAAISENIIFGHKTIGGIIFTHGDTGIGISRIKKNDSRLPIKATEAGEV